MLEKIILSNAIKCLKGEAIAKYKCEKRDIACEVMEEFMSYPGDGVEPSNLIKYREQGCYTCNGYKTECEGYKLKEMEDEK